MLGVSDSAVLSMTASNLLKKLKSIKRWKGKFKTPVDGKIPIKTISDVENLIDLLSEKFTRSEISGQEYETDVKKKVKD